MVLAVIGGATVGTALDAVVALATDPGDGPAVFCTGVVVNDGFVLTAAHCVDAAEALPDEPLVVWGTDLVAGDAVATRGWAEAIRHPSWSGGASPDDHDDDLALLALDGPAAGDAATFSPDPPAVGDVATFTGFGATTEAGEGTGVKRATTLEVLSLDVATFESYAAGTNLCSGDSGGPAVVGGRVVGIDTFVDPTCLGGAAGSTRLDVHLDWVRSVAGELSTTLPDPDEDEPSALAREDEHGCATGPGGGLPGVAVGVVALRRRAGAARKPQ